MMPQFEVLGSLVRDINGMLSQMYYLALPVAIALAVVLGYFQNGGSSQVETLKRAFIATILLISFSEVSTWIVNICDGVALKIDNMAGLDTFLRMVQEKTASYSISKNVLLLQFNDLFIAVLSFLSFLVVLVARYITIAMYYFYWVFLSAISPILILLYIFPSTAHITRNMYKSLIEVACWKICWAVLSAMLASLSLGNIYQTEGSYVTLIVLNFVIAVSMIMTPIIVKSLVGDGATAASAAIGGATVMAMTRIPLRAVQAKQVARMGANAVRDTKSAYANYHQKKFISSIQKQSLKEVRK